MCRVAGRLAIHNENKLIMKLAKSVRRWAASVAMARLFDRYPPTASPNMKIKHKALAKRSFFRAPELSSCLAAGWQCSSEINKFD